MKKISKHYNETIFIILFMLSIAMATIIFTISNTPSISTNIIQEQSQQLSSQQFNHSGFTCDQNICIFEIENNYEYCSYIKDTRKNEILKIDCYKK